MNFNIHYIDCFFCIDNFKLLLDIDHEKSNNKLVIKYETKCFLNKKWIKLKNIKTKYHLLHQY